MININEYFDGAVKSLAYENGGKSTVGVISSGEYEFGTSTHETMSIIEGDMQVLLPGESDWKSYEAGDQFVVAANTLFKIKVSISTSYLCKYN